MLNLDHTKPLEDKSDDDEDDDDWIAVEDENDSESCRFGGGGGDGGKKKKEGERKNLFYPIIHDQPFSAEPLDYQSEMMQYRDMLIEAALDKSAAADPLGAKVVSVSCQWDKKWGSFHEFTDKDTKLNFYVEMSFGLQHFQPLGPEDLFQSFKYVN